MSASPAVTRENFQALLGPRVPLQLVRSVQYEIKPGKFEQKTLLLTNFRLYLFSMKTPLKVELSFNLLELSSIESSAPNKLLLSMDSKKLSLQSQSEEISVDDIIFNIFEILWNVFPDVPLERLISKIEISPSGRQKELLERVEIVKRPSGLCGNFSLAYAMVCDRASLPFQDDVAWDVDTIYHVHETTELNLSDFEYLEPRLYGTIVGALRHNQYFTGLNLSGVKLGNDCIQELLEVLKVNANIRNITLSNTGIKHDFIQKLVSALSSNTSSALVTLDLSGNVLEEKGIQNLCSAANVVGRLTSLNMSGCGVTSKALTRLIESCFSQNRNLQSLDLSDNPLKDELASLQKNVLSHPSALTSLKLSGTDCPVEQMLNSISQGCTQTLIHLDLSKNPLRKSSRDSTNVSSAWRQFFSSAVALQVVNLSSIKILPEAIRETFHGLSSNSKICVLEFNLSGNSLGQNGAAVLEAVIPVVHNVRSLDLSDNAFDQGLANVALAFTKSTGYRKVALGKNFTSNKLKNISKILDSVAQLLQVEKLTVESLSLDDLKIRSDVTIILNALGTNTFLTELDISGNQMGDAGANLLGKALQINCWLTTVSWDGNGTTVSGFGYLATALVKNFSLKRMPTPVVDVAAALRGNQEKVLQALKKIDSILVRNQDPMAFISEPSYRLQQSFLSGTSQQILDKMASQVQDVIRHLQCFELSDGEKQEVDGATKLIKEERSVCNMFMELHKLSAALTSPSDTFYTKLKSFQTEIQRLVGKQLQAIFGDAIKAVETMFPCALNKQSLPSDLKTTCCKHYVLPDDFLKESIVDQLGAEILRKALDLQLTVFTNIVTFVVEELLKSLHNKLTSLSQISSRHQDESTRSPSVETRTNSVSRESKNKIGNVRQTMMSRMLRPQSTVYEDMIVPEPDEVFEDEYLVPTDINTDVALGKSVDTAAGPRPVKTNEKPSSSPGRDTMSELPISPPLQNLRWNRPKRDKMHPSNTVEGIYDKNTNVYEEIVEDDNTSIKSDGSQGVQEQQNGTDDPNNNKNGEVPKPKPAAGSNKPALPVPAKPGNGNSMNRKTVHPPREQDATLKTSPATSPSANSPSSAVEAKILPTPKPRVKNPLPVTNKKSAEPAENRGSAEEPQTAE